MMLLSGELILPRTQSGSEVAESALRLLREATESQPPDTIVYEKVVDIVARYGAWEKARGLVQEMKENKVKLSAKVFNSLLRESVRLGDVSKSNTILRDMQQSNIKGNSETAILRQRLEVATSPSKAKHKKK